MAVSSMNVSAVAPEGYDVNNDGRVNIADAVAISMALSGNSKASDNTALDVNNNGNGSHTYGIIIGSEILQFAYSNNYL